MITQPVEGGGGGGGGATLSEEIIAEPTSYQKVEVTHPEIPLSGDGSGLIRFSGLFTVPGSRTDGVPYGNWDDQNLNSGNASWVQYESGDTGHFSVLPGDQLVVGVKVIFEDGVRYVLAITGNPTEGGNVQLSGGGHVTAAITAITGTGGVDDDVYAFPGCDFTGLSMPYSISPVILTKEDFDLLGSFTQLYTWGCNFPCRVAITVDGGTTWLSYNGTSWGSIDLADLRTDGIEPLGSGMGYYFLDSRGSGGGGVEIPSEAWDALFDLGVLAGEDFEMRLAAGLDPAGATSNLALWDVYLIAEATATVRPVPLGGMDAGFTSITRTTSTTAVFLLNRGWSSPYPSDWHCQVWTQEGDLP